MNLVLSGIMFKNKVVLITGASSGIGAATAKRFAQLEATLALVGRNLQKLTEVANECEKMSKIKPLAIAANLTNEEDVKRIIKSIITNFKKLDILVNNAAVIQLGSIETTTLAQFDSIMNTNIRAVFHLSNLAVPHLIKSKGNIVNVSSINGLRSFPNVLAYNMSKSALDQFTRCVALELASKQVRVNSVNPGIIDTPLHKRAGRNDEMCKEFLEHSKTTHPLGRVGKPEEVAEAIIFLANESQSSFITGVTLSVDGGRHALCPR